MIQVIYDPWLFMNFMGHDAKPTVALSALLLLLVILLLLLLVLLLLIVAVVTIGTVVDDCWCC